MTESCGSEYGYRVHKRNHEEACTRCKAAHSVRNGGQQKRKRTRKRSGWTRPDTARTTLASGWTLMGPTADSVAVRPDKGQNVRSLPTPPAQTLAPLVTPQLPPSVANTDVVTPLRTTRENDYKEVKDYFDTTDAITVGVNRYSTTDAVQFMTLCRSRGLDAEISPDDPYRVSVYRR
jgi:hypothetical protein